MIAEIYWDGGARPTNPGHAGIGVLVCYDGREYEVGRYIGIKTNNEAEFIGCLVGIKAAISLGADEAVLTGDSLLVIKTIEGEWKCKKDHLKPFISEIRKLLEKFPDGYEFVHVRGHQGHEENERVDTLCTDAIKYGICQHHNGNPFTVLAMGKHRIEGRYVDDLCNT